MDHDLSRLAWLLYHKSYSEGEFRLTSGRTSTYYFDCKPTALDPEGAYLLGKSLFAKLNNSVQGIGGMTLGADPLVSAVCIVSFLEDQSLPGFIVRKNPKSHGTKQYIEGLSNFHKGQRIALLEDVVTTGGSVLQACQRVTESGLEIVQILCVLDREEGGKEQLSKYGYSLEALFTRKSLMDHLAGHKQS